MTARVLGVAALAATISLLPAVSSAAPQAKASSPAASAQPSGSAPSAAPGSANLAPAPERLPTPLAVTVIFVVLWAALLGVAVRFASQAQGLQRDLDALERSLRDTPSPSGAGSRQSRRDQPLANSD